MKAAFSCLLLALTIFATEPKAEEQHNTRIRIMLAALELGLTPGAVITIVGFRSHGDGTNAHQLHELSKNITKQFPNIFITRRPQNLRLMKALDDDIGEQLALIWALHGSDSTEALAVYQLNSIKDDTTEVSIVLSTSPTTYQFIKDIPIRFEWDYRPVPDFASINWLGESVVLAAFRLGQDQLYSAYLPRRISRPTEECVLCQTR